MPAIETKHFGTTEHGQEVDQITLANDHGLVVKVMNYGCVINELHLPDRDGQTADCVLGFDNLRQYETDSPSFACVCGRVAGRTAQGKFELDGQSYQLTLNKPPHHLHGGELYFGKRVWDYDTHETEEGPSVTFTYTANDGEEGYPGDLDVVVVYTLTHDNALRLTYQAKTDAPTIVNLTNHAYFNLAGHASGDVLGHVVQINANKWCDTDDDLIPTGELLPVEGDPRDFTSPKPIKQDFQQMLDQPGGGYDLAYDLDNRDSDRVLAAKVYEPQSGRIMYCYTDQPAVVFYTGNMLHETFGGKGKDIYCKHAGVCFELQKHPDAVHHDGFPSIVLRPGETYTQTSEYRFAVGDGIEDDA